MINRLLEIISEEKIKQNVSMSSYTTFRTGGNADLMICPESLDELKAVIRFLFEENSPYYILGNGSNLLVSDSGIHIPVIHIGRCFSDVKIVENRIITTAGTMLASVAKKAMENSLSGFEFAAGIPGTVGGALIMNAGAYGGEIKDVVETVSFLDNKGEEHTYSNEEMQFSYRKSALTDSDCIIVGTTLKLSYGNKKEIEEKMADFASRRREKQPLEFPSAGSTFKRPEGYFAGALIESSGLKGVSVGGAQVSEKHAGFIINKGGATSSDIIGLIEIVKDTVYNKHGVILETEIKYWD